MLSGTVFDDFGPARFVPVVCVINNGTRIITTLTNRAGRYQFHVPQFACVVIALEIGLGVTITPPAHSVCPVCSAVSGLDFVISALTPTTVTVSGVVTQASGPVSGVTIIYTVDGQSASTITNANGAYSFSVPLGADVFIQPSGLPGVVFQPANSMLTNVTSDIINQNFFISSAFLVTVTATSNLGAPLSGVLITYTVNGQLATAMTNANGQVFFDAPFGSNVIIIPPSQTGFTVAPANSVLNNISSNNQVTFVYTPIV